MLRRTGVTAVWRRLAIAGALLAWVPPADAAADWLVVPFVGSAFGADSNFSVLEPNAGKSKVTFGGSVALLSDEVFGLEADFSHAPRFFQRDDTAGLVLRSHVTTLSGSVIAAVPLAVTQESLRPYLVGGLGLMHPTLINVLQVFNVDSNLLAMNVGGGAIGLISNRTGVRFEIRQFKNLRREPNVATGAGAIRLSFWRATVGVILRY